MRTAKNHGLVHWPWEIDLHKKSMQGNKINRLFRVWPRVTQSFILFSAPPAGSAGSFSVRSAAKGYIHVGLHHEQASDLLIGGPSPG